MEYLSEERTQAWQEWVLNRLVEKAFIRKKREVKGPYTTADFVMWLLNRVFGPSNWSFRVLEGPELVFYSETMGYSRANVQLTVRFANGTEVIHEEVGVWPMRASKVREGGTFETTTPEVYEQVLKSAVTDGLKACTDHLGNCFRPIADQELENFLRQRQAKGSLKDKGKSAAGEPPKKSNNDLFGEEKGSVVEPAAPKAMDDSIMDKPDYPRSMTELYKMAEERGISKSSAVDILTVALAEEDKTIKQAIDEKMPMADLWNKLITYAP